MYSQTFISTVGMTAFEENTIITNHAFKKRGRVTAVALAAVIGTTGIMAGPVAAQAAEPVSAQATAEPVVGGYTLSQARKIILDDTNTIRTGLGLKPVAESSALNTVAQNWTIKQANAGAMSHNPSYSSQYPSGWTTASENVAYGYSVTAVVAAWKASPGHYKNITQASANTLGIGVAANSSGRLYFTQNFATYPAGSTKAPVSSTPTPAPVTSTPTPAPVRSTPTPAPVSSTPSTPAPVTSTPTIRSAADFFAWARTLGAR
ncbi:CAP domain-containing protein [Mycetocola miduiensis]|uniref:CAP domain-containing protein n=1 Tax=Mycetocola miduiensis TaxID=995034 RepID=UPI0011604321|nr:CAP domain-containing protein [Mycetocola miduiensis]